MGKFCTTQHARESLVHKSAKFQNKMCVKLVGKLKSTINKQKTLIKHLRSKIKELENVQDSKLRFAFKEPEKPKSETCRDHVINNYLNDIKQAATEELIKQMNMVYEPVSGLYYDSNSGLYFSTELNLFYDGDKGCYMTLNESTKEYEFHSQAVFTDPSKSKEQRTESKHTNSKQKKALTKEKEEFREDGELSNSSSDDENAEEMDQSSYPPMLRLIVTETNVESIRTGHLFVVTAQGGVLGREGASLDVVIPDNNISKRHLEFSYNYETSSYECIDAGSRNGTIVDGKRLSESRQVSSKAPLEHASVIELSQTKLTCHIHEGYSTCANCEPGIIQSNAVKYVPEEKSRLSHKEQLKHLQRRYGLETAKYTNMMEPKAYCDRAKQRRKKIGSSCDSEKTQRTSLDTAISQTNKGFEMLTRLGWNAGETLGKTSSDGLLEPVSFVVRGNATTGLGIPHHETAETSHLSKQKLKILEKTKNRYKKLSQVD